MLELASHGSFEPLEQRAFFLSPPDCPFDFSRVRDPKELHPFFAAYGAGEAPRDDNRAD